MCDTVMPEATGCLLCGARPIRKLRTLSVATICSEWLSSVKLDVSGEFGDIEKLTLGRCDSCGLEFFLPPVTGSASLYERMQQFSWFYSEHKWDFDAALSAIPSGCRLLEIGCGSGHFLRLALRERRCRTATGLELNDKAVRDAVSVGLDVRGERVEALATTAAGTFDVVACFHVLEHVASTGSFVAACIDLLAPGGRLIISVPNNSSFIRLSPDNIFNQPPFHVLRWRPDSLRRLASMFGLTIERMQYESLSMEHLDWYANAHLDVIPDIRYLKGCLLFLVRRICVPFLRWTKWYRFLRGQAVLVCCRKS